LLTLFYISKANHTPLYYAIKCGDKENLDLVQCLLIGGADPRKKEKQDPLKMTTAGTKLYDELWKAKLFYLGT